MSSVNDQPKKASISNQDSVFLVVRTPLEFAYLKNRNKTRLKSKVFSLERLFGSKIFFKIYFGSQKNLSLKKKFGLEKEFWSEKKLSP